ncbi:MAG TPA: UDP-N-acetylmuramoyl-L-alanyl-D-glutamate--2,6-diaminopimelate ligase [Candidatus Saccharimonadales bacterium]|nr:UDP-N-acetylmuramoyl-L-alanyl-D-glutamate--2,6-diaminopimelate ligase [Candidatus Saccharimonadales bacterium]
MLRKIVKALIPRQLFKKIEPYGHLAEAVLANVINGFPARGLKVIGVTGTDGKTTTATLIYTMLNNSGHKTGLMTTIGYGTPDNWHDNYVHMTTVSSFNLMKRIKELKAQGIDWLVLETTSHALAQNRVWGIPYSVAVMTNVTHEHLDYHGTFERYRDAKLRLFKLANQNRRGLRAGIINAEDVSAELFAGAVKNPILYGLATGDLRAENVQTSGQGSMFKAVYKNRNIDLTLNLPGQFNIANALAAVGVGLAIGLKDNQIATGIAALKNVEGRMNTIDEGQDFSVIVDFAHTPDSFEKILSDLRSSTKGRLIAVFGSAGRRDEAKRSAQGQIAGKYGDLVVVTEEDDRDTDGNTIMIQIAEGAGRSGKREGEDLFMIHDRTKAIQYAVDQAKSGDTVVLLGKGHEKTMESADGEHPWDELAVARQAIRNRLDKQ